MLKIKSKLKRRYFSDAEIKPLLVSESDAMEKPKLSKSFSISTTSSRSSLNSETKFLKPAKEWIKKLKLPQNRFNESSAQSAPPNDSLASQPSEPTDTKSVLFFVAPEEDKQRAPYLSKRTRAVTISESTSISRLAGRDISLLGSSTKNETNLAALKRKRFRLKNDDLFLKSLNSTLNHIKRREPHSRTLKQQLNHKSVIYRVREPREFSHRSVDQCFESRVREASRVPRGASFSPRRTEISQKLRSLTNVLLHLRFSHSLIDINAKLNLLNAYLTTSNQNGLTFNQIKNSLVANLRDEARNVICTHSDSIKQYLLLIPPNTLSDIRKPANNQSDIYQSNDTDNKAKMTVMSDDECEIRRLYSSKSTDPNSIFSRLIDTTTAHISPNEPNRPTGSTQVPPEDNLSDTSRSLGTQKMGLISEVKIASMPFKYDDLGLYPVDNELTRFQSFLVEQSPTLKRLLANFLIYRQHASPNTLDSSQSSLGAMSIEDLARVYKCTSSHLAFKRSFSCCSRLELTQRYVKKSRSFEKFLVNVINGKKKSESMQCTVNHHQNESSNKNSSPGNGGGESSLKSISSVSVRSTSSGSNGELASPGVDEAGRNERTKWPLLKIDDSLRESSNDIDKNLELNNNVNSLVNNLESDLRKLDKELEENSDNYIPTTIRDALESAGINIDEIISMKNQLEMSLGSSINLSKHESFASGVVDKPDQMSDNNNNSNNNPKSDDQQKTSSSSGNVNSKSNQLVSVSSNLKSIDIKQNMSAKVSEQVENVNSAIARRPNGRKKSSTSSQNRYATVCNFITPQTDETINNARLVSSPSWMTHSEFELGASGSPRSECMSPASATLPSSSSLRASSSRQQIVPLPPITLAQFKPIVNIHKRTSTTPVANLNQLMNSTSTDSFLNLVGYSSSVDSPDTVIKPNHKKANHKSKALDKMKVTINEGPDDEFDESSTKRSKKKTSNGIGSVSRSFSYNIGKIIESSNRMINEQKKIESESPDNFVKKSESGKLATMSPPSAASQEKIQDTSTPSEETTSKTEKSRGSGKKSQNSKVVVNKSNTVQIGAPLASSDDKHGRISKLDTSKKLAKNDGLMSAPISQTGLDSSDSKFSSSSLIDESSQQDFAHIENDADHEDNTDLETPTNQKHLVSQPSIVINGLDEAPDNYYYDQEDYESLADVSDGAPANTTTLPPRLSSTDSFVNYSLRKYAVRRHHSAPQSDIKYSQAKRKAIVVQMYDTEKSYVEALKILVQKYYLPLKEKDIVERNLINDIFYKIPEIHVHHELLLSSLKVKYDAWDTRQTVGDVLLNIFAKQSVIETYISFVNNYRTSQEAIRISREQSSLFSKFVEQQAKDHRGKLTLKDLIIQPVQRIPRYELYIKDFLKCTPTNHPDYQLLLKAQKEVHNLAEKIDQVHKEVNETCPLDSQSVLQTIQDLIENLDDLVTAYRYYIRHDMVTIISSSGIKKDRCLFLFSDSIVLTSCKRRNTNVGKKINSLILNSPIGKQYLENIKHKLVMKFQLEDIDLIGLIQNNKKNSLDKDYLEEDLNTITRINELVRNLSYPHQNLDESLKEITAHILRQLNESSHQVLNQLNSSMSNINTATNSNSESDPKLNQLALMINTTERVETMTVVYMNPDHRISWEKCFIDAKKIFFESFSRKPATFLNSIAIPKNRSGVQFTCASARLFLTNDQNDVWICSTDGQMGQVCIMNTIPELAVTSCNTVCSARITCIQCVPPFQQKRASFYKKNNSQSSSNEPKVTPTDSQPKRRHNNYQPEASMIDFDSDSPGGDDDDDSRSENEAAHGGRASADEDDNLSAERDTSTLNTSNQTLQSNLADVHTIPTLSTNSYQEIKHSTMWIGNDDGRYTDNKVYVSLRNGDMVLFKRIYSIWNYDSFTIKTVSHSGFNCMINVAGKLWCASNSSIKVLNTNTLECEHSMTMDGERSICLAAGGNCTWAIWIGCANSLDLKLYHATKFITLAELNIKQCVCQKLNSCEELIRLHKISCLKITSLYVCKDTLWVGTSTGVLVNVKIPYINNATTKLNNPLTYNVLNHGHVGPVRFIASVDIPKQGQLSAIHITETSKDTNPKSPVTTNSIYRTVVISGGEGYEEYRTSSSSMSSNPTSLGVSSTNIASAVSGSGTNAGSSQQLQAAIEANMPTTGASNSAINMILAGSSMAGAAGISSSSSPDEASVGREDLVNYVLSWEI